MKRLYLDVDGVLLGKVGDDIVLAAHAGPFIDFVLANFDCYWLTTHCQGDSGTVLAYLSRFAPAELLEKMKAVKPTGFDVLKTRALTGDFYWIDDNPLAAEMTDLCRRKSLDRWIKINTRVNPEDLLRAVAVLQGVLDRVPAPARGLAQDTLAAVGEIS